MEGRIKGSSEHMARKGGSVAFAWAGFGNTK